MARTCGILALGLLATCGTELTPGPGMGMGPIAERPCDRPTAVGLFEIERAPDYTAISGAVAKAAAPPVERVLVASDGDCQLLRRANAFCDPQCASGLLCAPGGQCLPIPDNVNVGTVSVLGLKQPVRMEPKPNNQYFDTSLPPAAFDEGAPIRLEASGGAGPAFTLPSTGIGLLQLGEAIGTVAADRDLPITWTAGRVPARVLVEINVDQHGTTPVTLACEVADSGQLSLKASLVGTLLGFGVSGFPTLTVTRRAASSTDLPAGCVGLHVFSASHQALKVSGHTPCKRDSDCPAGLSCDVIKESCR